jgi:peroxiredoxin
VDFKLTNALGRDVILFEELAKGPVVLVFYRGGWCPFCNMQLKAYLQIIAGNPSDGSAAYSD